MWKVVGGLVLCVALLAGCGSTAEPTLAPAEIMAKAGQRMEAVNSFHFALTQEGGGTPIAMGLEMTQAEGDVARPNKLHVTVKAAFNKMVIQVQVVTVGDETYMTNPLTRAWEPVRSELKAISLFDPGAGVMALVNSVTDLQKMDDESIDGEACYHFQGKIAARDLKALTVTYVEGAAIECELWVDKDDFSIRQVRLKGRITEAEPEGIVRTVKLTQFDQSVDIKLPK